METNGYYYFFKTIEEPGLIDWIDGDKQELKRAVPLPILTETSSLGGVWTHPALCQPAGVANLINECKFVHPHSSHQPYSFQVERK